MTTSSAVLASLHSLQQVLHTLHDSKEASVRTLFDETASQNAALFVTKIMGVSTASMTDVASFTTLIDSGPWSTDQKGNLITAVRTLIGKCPDGARGSQTQAYDPIFYVTEKLIAHFRMAKSLALRSWSGRNTTRVWE